LALTNNLLKANIQSVGQGQDQRRHTRVAARANDVKHPEFTCLDISESGLKFHANRKVSRGTVFKAQLNLLDEPISVECQVMWCNESPSIFEAGYHIGVKFNTLPISSELQLRKVIESR